MEAGAQTRRRFDSSRRYEQRVRDYRYGNRVYSGRRYQRWDEDRWNDDESFWDRHRDKLTTAIGAGAGTVVGSAVGGKKGALVGALLGGGGAALYTYGIRDDDDDNFWRQRRRY